MSNMTPEANGAASNPRPEAAFAEALKDLTRGEQTATALEHHLDALEQKIEELLAQAEKNQKSSQPSTTQNQSNASQ